MELVQKLAILADAAKYDASCASSGVRRRGGGSGVGNSTGVGICHSYTPDGRCVSLLKILLTNYCVYDCQYCVNRISSDVPRARFTVDEVVRLTLDFYQRNYIEGLFLSSGVVRDGDSTMKELAEVARRLRVEHEFRGYIHLKTIPGAAEELIAEAGRWADRLSVNIEMPTPEDLKRRAPEKSWSQVRDAMGTIAHRVGAAKAERRASRRAPNFAPAGQSTQMIVGATESSDRVILTTVRDLYDVHRLKRVYYSAFSPIPHADARLPATAPPLVREHRLYQADWLMRFYGFRAEEIVAGGDDNLRIDLDPKLAWALRHPEFFPVDLNRADREALLRVPGLGVRTVGKLLALRRHRSIRLGDLEKLRMPRRRALPFVVTADVNPHAGRIELARPPLASTPRERQLTLFDAAVSARSGEF